MHYCIVAESIKFQQVAHISNNEENEVKTALIPFCEFGGSMSAMGVKIDQFDVPVCNSFRPKMIMDQLCFQVDPNEYKHNIDLKGGDISLSLFVHYNDDRQMEDIDYSQEPFITVNTIGNIFLFKITLKAFVNITGNPNLYP